ncbi:MAG: hypothetical protein QNJ41_21475 [Xenococcaceae cyanobacterium MO_188.B32]|nr:hypothetical protein [Xenococcaceae cyanobacterium MO_188.B32]
MKATNNIRLMIASTISIYKKNQMIERSGLPWLDRHGALRQG